MGKEKGGTRLHYSASYLPLSDDMVFEASPSFRNYSWFNPIQFLSRRFVSKKSEYLFRGSARGNENLFWCFYYLLIIWFCNLLQKFILVVFSFLYVLDFHGGGVGEWKPDEGPFCIKDLFCLVGELLYPHIAEWALHNRDHWFLSSPLEDRNPNDATSIFSGIIKQYLQ